MGCYATQGGPVMKKKPPLGGRPCGGWCTGAAVVRLFGAKNAVTRIAQAWQDAVSYTHLTLPTTPYV